jgi:hypothetical protein
LLKFGVSIIPVNCSFCVVTANPWCIHLAKLITAACGRYGVFTPIRGQGPIICSSRNPK